MFTIPQIIATLNDIEIKGKDNMDKLLGCIMALEAIEQVQNNAAKEQTNTLTEIKTEGENG